MSEEITDSQRIVIATNAVNLLNEALLLDREGISRLLKALEMVSDRFDRHPNFHRLENALRKSRPIMVRDYDRFDRHPNFHRLENALRKSRPIMVRDYWGDNEVTAMTPFGLFNSLIGLVDGRGLIIMEVDDQTDEIIKFSVRKNP